MNIENVTFDDMMVTVREQRGKIFKLNQPAKVTYRHFQGSQEKYVRKPLIGGETFAFQDAYFGKRKQIIFKFILGGQFVTDEDSEKDLYECFEMGLKEANEKLSGFREWVDGIFAADFDKSIKAIRAQTLQVEQKRAADAMQIRHAENKHYGSW